MKAMIVGSRELSPDAVSVTPMENRILRVRFANGELRDFDVTPPAVTEVLSPSGE